MGLGGQGLVKFTCLLRFVPTDVATDVRADADVDCLDPPSFAASRENDGIWKRRTSISGF